ncbi:selenide, water dikinase SelD [Thiothrix fructosivorans]|uniref:Selenide, water dikinase n=1 Tax=Thiothrix fructosivorans TaxID=111770 RepID=A0A8B0SFZ8_9GAMM|nr:selenide, water dikinase SelD [Thiothrix fructosivorans]MBO0614899.1 selenide, water dikinase SelD [Thiothrix fructosivorans]QTX09709.1 selenide, water dikinase SelD [Thiothrix fructosivorans]
METPIRMTEYSHGSGCGCKIAPAVLDVILHSQLPPDVCDALLVGNSSRDDAAVYDLGNGTAVISTTDFFMPIVDDPFTFGRIAATNAISDVYAMGGKPIMAIAIFGWPLDKLPPEVGREVVEGGRKACQDAGIPLAGGHSIDAPEPIFGLAVTGIVQTRHLKQNSTAQAGCKLYLTKPLGIGILTTAQKRKVLLPEHSNLAIDTMCQMNTIGAQFGEMPAITALTDVTGFGLGGHLREMCEGSGLQAVIQFDQVPVLPHIPQYLELDCSPGGAKRNFDSYGYALGAMTERQQQIICDPQTSGGLLVALAPEGEAEFLAVCQQAGLDLQPIGYLREPVADSPLITME